MAVLLKQLYFFIRRCYNAKGGIEVEYLSETIKAAVWGDSLFASPIWFEWIHHNLSDKHCEECLKLDMCWFAEGKLPNNPHHLHCHCKLKEKPYNEVAEAIAAYSKFNPYLFNVGNKYIHQKQVLFEKWGYGVEDSKYLQSEIEKQGLLKYLSGEYSIGNLNSQGQRINIRVEIPNKRHGGKVSFVTGWMVHPNGKITLNTPYGGK